MIPADIVRKYCQRMEWIDATELSDLGPTQSATIERDDGDILVWRTASGQMVACEARCPHQWAHLGSAGAVDGEELVCRSHFWRFAVDGVGTKLAARGRRDEKSPIRTFELREREGRVEIGIEKDSGR